MFVVRSHNTLSTLCLRAPLQRFLLKVLHVSSGRRSNLCFLNLCQAIKACDAALEFGARNRWKWRTQMTDATSGYTYIFHVVLFSAVAPKGRNFSSSCKEKFFCKKNAVVKNVSPCGRVMSPLGRVMSPFGRAMSPLQNDYNYLENLKKRRSAKKRLFFRKSCFSSKKAEF